MYLIVYERGQDWRRVNQKFEETNSPHLTQFYKTTLLVYYQDKAMKDLINKFIFNVNKGDNKVFNNDVSLNNVCVAYEQIHPHTDCLA